MDNANHHDALCVIGMNRIRAGYLEMAPDLERFFVMGSTDDIAGIGKTMGGLPNRPFFVDIFAATPTLVAVLNSVIAATIVALAAIQVGVSSGVAIVAGAIVAAYATRPAGSERRELLRALIEERGLDAILFSSSSMVDAIVELLGDDARRLLPRVALASIGPITSASLARHGLSADVTAEHYTLEGLLDALERHFQPRPGPLSVSPAAT
jgi:hypothetical protein